MHSSESFRELTDEIQSLGYDEETAARFAALIGDTPCFDSAGLVIVVDQDGAELARLLLSFFGP